MEASGETRSQEEKAEEAYRIIVQGLAEVLGGDRIRRALAEKGALGIYWGTATTGKPHVAYLLPMLKISDFLRAGCRVTVLFADLHAVLDSMKATFELVGRRVAWYKLVIQTVLKELGVDLESVRFVEGSAFQLCPKYVLDMHRLSTLVSVHDAQRAGAEVVKQADNPLLSSLVYPGMQALDEEYLEADAQFGGLDQRKIFVYAEKYLPLLGYGKRAHLMSPIVPGLGGGKMSSSESGSKIDFTDTDADIKKKISRAFCEEGNTEKNGVLALATSVLIPLLQRKSGVLEVEIYRTKETRTYSDSPALIRDFASKTIHPGDLKKAVSESLCRALDPIRKELHKHTAIMLAAYPLHK